MNDYDYLYDADTVRLAIILGVLVTTLFYERVQITTGGAIVPGYLALFVGRPLYIAATLITSYLTYLIVNSLISRRYILYGRRKYEIEILTTLCLVSFWFGLAHLLIGVDHLVTALVGIGFVLPAIIAHDVFRQGARKTYLAILANVAIIATVIYVFSAFQRVAPWHEEHRATGLGSGPFAFSLDLLLPAIFVSVLAGMAVFHRLGLRCGGFVSGAYLGLHLLRPLDLVFTVAVSLATFLLVTRVLMHYMLIFGRRKLGMMILIAAILAWAGEIALRAATDGSYVPWDGFHVITLMVPALIANDAQRQGMERTLWGAALTAVAVFASMNLLQAGLFAAGLL
ncbi:hypothetical protein BH23CHL5_BH23CHL5_05980 [soil metagenome]